MSRAQRTQQYRDNIEKEWSRKYWSFIQENLDKNLLRNIKVFYKTKKELDRLCSKDQISHQGLIAEIEHLEKIL